jgi:hypothetical protein
MPRASLPVRDRTEDKAGAMNFEEYSDETLLKTFAALTHQIHADSGHISPARLKRDEVEAEILRRMKEGR